MGKKYKRGTCPSCLGDKFISRANGTCNQCTRFKKSRPNYHVYIRSDLWQLKSYQAKRRARFKCEECGKKPKRLETHHKTYARLGNERDEDLIVLCPRCHDSRHVRKAQPKQHGTISATPVFDNGPKQ